MFPLNSACVSNATRDCEVGRVIKPSCTFGEVAVLLEINTKKPALIPQLRIVSLSFRTLCET